jgi:hypothetical protein
MEDFTMHIEAISNGLGAQSMAMVVLAAQGKIHSRLSITADTGWENDRLWSDGTRAGNAVYVEQVLKPYATQHGIDVAFVRSVDRNGEPMAGLGDWMRSIIADEKLNNLKIPLYGSNGGRLGQSCTGRMKVSAIRQELRRRGATSARNAHGLHRGEIHRMKGHSGRVEAGFYTVTDMDVNWCSHYYPLIDLGLFRSDCQRIVQEAGLPFLLSSECDGCPHKDWPRWERTSQRIIDELADMESGMGGQFFFTNERIPLKEALPIMQAKWQSKQTSNTQASIFDDPDFGCDEGGVCGV